LIKRALKFLFLKCQSGLGKSRKSKSCMPIVSILNLISALFFGSITLKLYFSYRENKDENVGDFLKASLFLTILLILIASPGLLLTNSRIIGLIYAIYPFFAFLSLGFFSRIPLRIIGWERIKKIFFKGVIGIASLITLLNLLNLGPAIVYHQDSFIYWKDTRGIIMNVVIGIVFSFNLLLVITFFLVQGFKSSERFVRARSIFISAGLLSFALVSIVNFIFGALAQIYLASLLATFFNILAAFLILAGIYYKPKESP
jgi:hypothetical protein